MDKVKVLERTAAEVRGRILEVSHRNRIPHLASSMSCVDLLVVLYGEQMKYRSDEPLWDQRDRFILSKGHAASALYTVLSKYVFFPDEALDTHGKPGSRLEEHPSRNCVPGVEVATGTLGHGLPVANGMALAAKIKNESYHTYVILGDGECNEGTIWEGAMFAAGHKLGNLTVFVDFNKWQATDRSCDVLHLECLCEKFKAFGWNVCRVNGNSIRSILEGLQTKFDNDKPTAFIADTTKGAGISFAEDDNNWHYRIPSEEEVAQGNKELGL